MVPAHHIYGFIFTALLADELDVEVWPGERASPGHIARTLRPGDLVVSFPERWIWLERSIPEWPPDVVGVTSTAPCPDGLVAALRERGLARMVEIYGSSETAGIAWRDEPEAAYALMPQWHFAADSETEPSSLVHATGSRAVLPDRVERVGSRAFRLRGRIDGAVQVGGINVYVERIGTLLGGASRRAGGGRAPHADGGRRPPESLRRAGARCRCGRPGDRLAGMVGSPSCGGRAANLFHLRPPSRHGPTWASSQTGERLRRASRDNAHRRTALPPRQTRVFSADYEPCPARSRRALDTAFVIAPRDPSMAIRPAKRQAEAFKKSWRS